MQAFFHFMQAEIWAVLHCSFVEGEDNWLGWHTKLLHSEDCGISASPCRTIYCTPATAPGGVASSPTDPRRRRAGWWETCTRNWGEASLSKQGLEWTVLQYGLVCDSLKLPTALLAMRLPWLINQTRRSACSLNIMYWTPRVNVWR